MLLSDIGAEVIKIERPHSGDETRRWGPPFIGEQAAYFLAVNRNKKSVAVDLKRKEGIQIIEQLVAKSDVFIENYIPGKLHSLGLGYEHLKKINPGLIYCSISGFGSTGPYAKRPGFDVIAASVGGLLSITGPENGPPCKVGVAITDITTGLYANGAILAALYQRQQTGVGTKIDCNLLSSQVSVLVNLAINYLNAGLKAPRRDGKYITIGCGSDAMFHTLCRLLFPEEEAVKLLNDDRFKTNVERVENRVILIDLLSKQFRLKPISHWTNVFEGSGIPFGPVNEFDDVFNDPQVMHNESVINVDHPTAGNIKLLGPAVKYSEPFFGHFSAPPLLGQHTETVLKDVLGYDSKRISFFNETNVVQCSK
ncbi:succinate--hydroxymethylglutarate CoA-transferase-like protein [Dinothrombium tinctorium]|uniref:Succinate--hydroxymethylglutarate CoA-transferase-like protein n=1 Tax=Dinothrombium tinctorium TaxID=1965070 RepID=A0A3S3PEL1_9ACAR|nr:succinate--hydroxymethylglutarate CoA-transferase-like protein [Dinothrombium tinctorium]